MEVTIESVTLAGFGTPEPKSGGSPAIHKYDGSTLYCHVKPAADGSVEVTFDQAGPDEFLASGPIGKVTVQYQNDRVAPPVQTLVWEGGLPGGPYNGGTTTPYLNFSVDRKTVSVVLPNTPAKDAADPPAGPDIPTLSLVVLTSELTGHGPQAHFVNIPLDPNCDFRAFTTARVVWPPATSFAGPIGSVEVP